MSAIEVKNLVKKFHGQTVLHGIDLEVKPGEVVAIIGPSGSGKTTLLRSINLLEQPEAGTITVGDITIDTARSLSQQKSLIRQLRQHVGFVFQNFNLFPHRTVLENIIEGSVIFFSMDTRTRRMDSERSKGFFCLMRSRLCSCDTSSIRRTSRLKRRLSSEMIRRYCFSSSGEMTPSKIPSA